MGSLLRLSVYAWSGRVLRTMPEPTEQAHPMRIGRLAHAQWTEEHVKDWLEGIRHSPAVTSVAEAIARGGAIAARGLIGSSGVVLVAALRARTDRPIVFVTAHLDEADEAVEQLRGFGIDAARLPALEYIAAGEMLNQELLAERLMLIDQIERGACPPIIATPIQALMQRVPTRDRLAELLRVIRPGQEIRIGGFAAWLTEIGFDRVETIESPGEFAVRGGIVDIFLPAGQPVRIDLFGDEVDGIFEIDLDTMGSDRRLERLEIVGATAEQLQDDKHLRAFAEVLPQGCVAIVAETIEIAEQGRSYMERAADAGGIADYREVLGGLNERSHALTELNQFSTGASDQSIELPLRTLPSFAESPSEALGELVDLSRESAVIVCCQNDGEAQRMGELLAEFAPEAPVEIETRYLFRGFCWDQPALALVPYHELLHRYHTPRTLRPKSGGKALDTFIDLQPGDYVVHRDHGIARFLGLQTLKQDDGTSGEYLTLEFARGAKRHVPAAKIELVQKYIGAFQGAPELSTIGGKRWKNQKERVGEAVRDLAAEMLRMQAARAAMAGIRYPADTAWQREFEAEFPYEETEDQLAAIAAAKRDMIEPRPMDRLVCGDVGFGKTEVAIRAAFKAIEFGRQVAVLVPTTVLCEQHERTFKARLADYPFRVESVSRFKTKKQQADILADLRKGQVDVIIGTHRLLSKDVSFADLGLVVIDEEQRFGVEHKQRLLEFRATADVLTLTATPIPRTLHMALLGLRDISSLTTPPLDRRSIVTEVMAFDEARVKRAIERELAREGQVFFVHNRVHDIEEVASKVRIMAPGAKVIVGHGQMPARALERVMLQFIRGQADILVSTSIIESGIDIPTANTMIINDATIFGLSDLHQLRGRVGRYKHRAYCYMMLPQDKTISEVALKRLRAIEAFSMLGAGFKIALRDLEIRGAGNLLGAEQSGHIAAVGYEMYCQLLEHAVAELKKDAKPSSLDTTIDLDFAAALPKGYIPSDARRMDAYRRISRAQTAPELEAIEHDLVSAYGSLPGSAEALVLLAELRIRAAGIGVKSITRHENDVIFKTAKPALLEAAMRGGQGTLRLVGQPDGQGLVDLYYRPPPSFFEGTTLLTVLRRRLAREDAQAPAGVS